MALPLTDPEARCLLCDAVFADNPTPGRSVVRCRECGRNVYADTTTAAIVAPSAPATPASNTGNPTMKSVELYDLESVAESEPPKAGSKDEVPLVHARSSSPPSPAKADLPEAKPVSPSVKLPEWATRRPGGTSVPTPSSQATPTVATPRPISPTVPTPSLKSTPVTSPTPGAENDSNRPHPELAKALFVLALFFVLFIAAIGVLAYAIIYPLTKYKKNLESQKAEVRQVHQEATFVGKVAWRM